MPVRKRRVPTKRHGTRNFILETLETTRKGPAAATAAIIKQVRKLAGKRIPEETIRSSLKTLVRQRVVKGRKIGHEKVYKLVPAGSSMGSTSSVSSETRPIPRPVSTPRADPAELAAAQPLLPHKLAVGEVLILEIGAAHVETATNVHGKVVLERHARQRGPSQG
ncbi:MAG: hypothetical protein JRN24_00235 [Nitrososphaerota archaeon]|nr:hypothetical protein [Nitrososphaerota archaeon]